MTELTPSRGALIDRVALGCAITAVLLAALTIALPAAFPCQDAPGHLLAAQVHLHPERFVGLYEPQQALTGQSFVTMTVVFGQLLGLMPGARIALLVGLGMQVAGALGVARRTGADPAVAVAGAAVTFVGWSYVMGFFSFSLALAFGVLGWSFWLDRQRTRSLALAALWLALAAWSHAIGAALVLCHIGLVELLDKRWHLADLRRWVAMVPSAGWVVGTSLAGVLQYREIGAIEQTGSTWLRPLEALHTALMAGVGSYSPLAVVATLLGLGLAAAAALRDDGVRRANGRAALIWLFGFFVLPFHGLGWHFASPRLLAMGSGFFTAASARVRWVGAAFAIACVASLAAGLPVAIGEGGRIAASIELFGDQPVGRTYVVTHRPEAIAPIAPWARPNIGTGRYATFAGGADPGAFAFPSLKHSMHFVGSMAALFPNTRQMLTNVDGSCIDDPACAAGDIVRADRVAATAVNWDSVTLVEASAPFAERLLSRGFVPQSAAVLRPRPGTVIITFAVPPGLEQAPVRFEAGWPETIGPFRGGTLPPSSDRPAELTLTFSAVPAGPLRVHAWADLNSNAQADADEPSLWGPGPTFVEPGATVELSSSGAVTTTPPAGDATSAGR